MGLEEYDLYALKSYSFTVRKTHSFFSLPTVLLSLAVFIIAVLINFNTVRHLWLPLNQLDIISSSSIQLPEALTSTVICMKPSDPANKNRFLMFGSDKVALQLKSLSEEEVGASYPRLKSQIGSGFGCVDMQGYTFLDGDDVLYIEVQDPAATLYISTNSLDQVLYDKVETATVLTSSKTSQTPTYPITFLKLTIYDRLYLNYDPHETNTFMTNSILIENQPKKADFNVNYTYFKMKMHYPSSKDSDNILANVFNITIARKNIGDIFGAVLSWISILALLISFLAAPLMDMTLNLLTAESLYHLQPHMQNPSLLKFMVARLRKGIFHKEDQYVQMCSEVEKMKDVNRIVKMQMLLSRLVPKSRSKAQELISSEHNFNQVAKNEVGVELFIDKTQSRPLTIDISEDQKQENCLSWIKKEALCALDEGSDPVSVAYGKGGIGSKGSFCVFLLAGVGLLVFLVIFGLLKAQTSIIRSKNSVGDKSYTINSYTIFFGVFSSSSSPPTLTIMDGSFNRIRTVPTANETQCSRYLTNAEIADLKSISPIIYCVPSPVELVRSRDPSETRSLSILKSGFGNYPLYMKQNAPNSYFKPINKIVQIPLQSGGMSYNELPLMVVEISSPSLTTQNYQLLPSEAHSNLINKQNSNFVILNEYDLYITEETTSFFDGVENVWTFTIICFTIIVMKLTKYINLKHKQETCSPDKLDFRDSICIFLARMDGLLHGRHRGELERIKYYLKEPLSAL